MYHKISLDMNRNSKTRGQGPITQQLGEKSEQSNMLTSLKKGQIIEGLITEVGETIGLKMNGQIITLLKESLKNPRTGDRRLFEVKEASEKEVTLRELEEDSMDHTRVTIVKFNKDQMLFLSQKEYLDKLAEKDKKNQNLHNQMEEILSKMTEADYKTIEEEGFPVETLTIEGLYEGLRRLKHTNDSEVNNSANNDQNGRKNKQIELKELLQANNLPVTKETLQKLTTAVSLIPVALKINDKTMRYLIHQELEPNIGNLYKAQFSGETSEKNHIQKLNEATWNQLLPQLNEIIKDAGYDINEKHQDAGKWLIENQLPMTKNNFKYLMDLKTKASNLDESFVVEHLMKGMKNGLDPMEINLITTDNKKLEEFVNQIQSIGDTTIHRVIAENKDLTLHNLIETQNLSTIQNKTISETAVSSDEGVNHTERSENQRLLDEVTAKRQLEEIRLKMTVEAAGKLYSKGLSIDTEPLERVVEELRELENSYYKELLKEGALEPTDTNVNILKDTSQTIDAIRYMPSYTLGITLAERKLSTLSDIHSTGLQVQADLVKANAAYETLMTVPNKEYGDSLYKAFQNTASILESLSLENTLYNQRAVRILGYNQMEITAEAINRVKAYDMEVNNVIHNLHPAVTLRLMKEGINPLGIPISELNNQIKKLREEQGIKAEDKYSSFLRRLDKEGSITENERKSYIGIYRLLHHIEKSDGAAIGSVVKSQKEVTLDNLLTALQIRNKGSLDLAVNDDFGELESITFQEENIRTQLKGAFLDQQRKENKAADLSDGMEEAIDFYDGVSDNLIESITPHKLLQLHQALLSEQSSTLSSDTGIWEALKGIPVEKIFDQLNYLKESTDQEEQYYSDQMQQLRNVFQESEAALRFLNDYNMPSTIENLWMANNLINNGSSLFRKLNKNFFKEQEEDSREKSTIGLNILSEDADIFRDKNSMVEKYEKLKEEVHQSIDHELLQGTIDASKLRELKSIRTQMSFALTLAKKEFYQIPIETAKGITNMNLTILRGTESMGRVSITVQSEKLGFVKAEATLKENAVHCYILSDNQSGIELLKGRNKELETAFHKNKLQVKQLDYGILDKIPDHYRYKHPELNQTNQEVNSEKILYQVAKTFVQMIYTIEKED